MSSSTPSSPSPSNGLSPSLDEQQESLEREVADLKERLRASRAALVDTTFERATGDVKLLRKVRFKCLRTYKGHLAKVFAVQWATDSIYVVSCAQVGLLVLFIDSFSYFFSYFFFSFSFSFSKSLSFLFSFIFFFLASL